MALLSNGLLLWLIAGLAAGGVLVFLTEFATGKRFNFAFSAGQNVVLLPAAVFVRLIAGPALLVRGAVERLLSGRDDGVLPAGFLVLAIGWSVFSGWLLSTSIASLASLAH